MSHVLKTMQSLPPMERLRTDREMVAATKTALRKLVTDCHQLEEVLDDLSFSRPVLTYLCILSAQIDEHALAVGDSIRLHQLL